MSSKNPEERKSLTKKLEALPIKNFHYFLLILLGIGWAFDAMSAGLISFGLTPLADEFGLGTELVGFLLSAWNIGMLVGAFLLGSLADRIGRRTPLLLSVALYSLPTGLIAFANSWRMVKAWHIIFLLRFIAGMGSSAYMAIGSTHLSEYLPKKKRGRWVSFLESSWAFGWLIASYLGLILVSAYGWRGIMLVGFIPLFFLLPLAFLLPESLRYLLQIGKKGEAESILNRIGLSGDVVGEETRKKAIKASEKGQTSIKELFTGKYKKRTIMLWIHWFSIVLTYWGIFLWLPSVLAEEKGLGVAKSLLFAFVITAAQIPGYWSGAWLIEIVGRKPLLCVYMALAGLFSFLFALSTVGWQVLLFASLVSFFNLGAWGATYAYTPELYPTSVRATGSGAANSIGRFGGILGPLLAGFLAARFEGFYYVFTVFAIFHFISAVTVGILGIETKGKPLEE